MITSAAAGRWNFRVNARSDEIVREAATLAGQDLTAFVVESAVTRAGNVIAERERLTLSPDAFVAFSAALDDAPRAIPELVDLFSRNSDRQ